MKKTKSILPVTRVLIANRGEIAVRIIRSCREMGITTVAVYSEADRLARHVGEADLSVEIGPPAPLQSYLNIDKLLEVAIATQCDAIHPGYGFLSENAAFARRVAAAGLTFIGPSPAAMEKVGDKLTARATMIEAGIPLTPGIALDGLDGKAIAAEAVRIGYPVMIKASAGGGGKGMRVVEKPDELSNAIEASRREAKSAFDNDTVYMEKYIRNPRHIEFQVLADTHGNIVHLFERECSIQRRHQKIVEETPSPALDVELRQRMGETACRVMAAVDYTNAGTVEFLLDENKKFYFLEVNARIQVEHPITECVSGIDLVRQQIKVARGETLEFSQADLRLRGHAVECRIYAEDPENNFLPSIGKLVYVREPAGPGIRCDSGIYSGLEVSHYYDPILSKLIVFSENRDVSLQKMHQALTDYVILGVKTPLAFLRDLLAHPAFISGDTHTGFLKQHFPDWKAADDEQLRLFAMAISAEAMARDIPQSFTAGESQPTVWQTLGSWESF